MAKMKFNIGDTVICCGTVVCDGRVGRIVCATDEFGDYRYGVQIEGYSGHDCNGFKLCAGDYPTGRNSIWVRENNLNLVSASSKYQVVITSDGKKTEAVKYIDGKVVAKGVSSCDERYDKFSFKVGTRMALDRMETDENNRNLYNGKAIAFNFDKRHPLPKCFTPNKIYQFKDGYPVDVENDTINSHKVPAVTNDDMKNNTGWIQNWFIPVVE